VEDHLAPSEPARAHAGRDPLEGRPLQSREERDVRKGLDDRWADDHEPMVIVSSARHTTPSRTHSMPT